MSENESDPEFSGPIGSWDSFWKKVYWVLVASIVIVIVIYIAPVVLIHSHPHTPYGHPVQNLKQVGYALFNFENDFGAYPNDETAKELDDGVVLSAAGGSNYYFSQLIAGGYVDQEAPFFVKRKGVMSPDNDQSGPEELLKSGEVGFAYVLWNPSMNSGNLPSDAPLALVYVDGRDRKLAKPNTWFKRPGAWLIVLRADLSVEKFDAFDDNAVPHSGKDYFDLSQPHWGGQKPRIVWPK